MSWEEISIAAIQIGAPILSCLIGYWMGMRDERRKRGYEFTTYQRDLEHWRKVQKEKKQ